jgi:phage FluMu gp28-like protein
MTLPSIKIDHNPTLAKLFMPHQIHWIEAEDFLRAQGKQTFALAEISVRIGWTFADAFKNVRKRLNFKNRDYLFATKDYPSALEYVRVCKQMADLFNFTRSIVSHGEEFHKMPRLDENGRPTAFTDEIKMGVIKFDNGSRILAFSSHPQAMAVYGGDVGLDEFAKHPNAKLLWETAQGRVALGHDLAVWSAHDGEDTLFHEFALEARAQCSADSSAGILACGSAGHPCPAIPSPSAPTIQQSNNPLIHLPATPSLQHSIPPTSPWNLYYRVTMPDAIELGLLDVINRVRGTNLTPGQFLADCRSRARQEEIYQQAYLCNPLGASTNHIVDWSAIERCRYDYDIIRLHLEHAQIMDKFGPFNPNREDNREREISDLIHQTFLPLFQGRPRSSSSSSSASASPSFRLGFDVAASGQGDLAVIYIDERQGDELWLRGLFTCRTEDWHFLQTVLFKFLKELRSLKACGDASGLGRQICWDAAKRFPGRFTAVNFSSKKHDMGFALMNQLATAQKRFSAAHHDIAADFFALRKSYHGARWSFSEGRNALNRSSHCDIAWAGALASYAHNENNPSVGGCVVYDHWDDARLWRAWPTC